MKKVLIVRTDSIGDVMLTLPMAYYIQQLYSESHVLFLGKSYTRDIVNRSPWVNEFINADDFSSQEKAVSILKSFNIDIVVFALPNTFWMKAAKRARIPIRVATGHRLSSWLWATHRPMFGRKNSDLHESQLNLKLLRPLGLRHIPDLKELGNLNTLRHTVKDKVNRLIIHPFSQGSALNWTLSQYDELVGILKNDAWEIVLSGTQKDAELLQKFDGEHLKSVTSVCGRFTLDEFIDFIAESTALLACSTGPLHIAAAVNTVPVGLYVNRRPIHPGRWSPIGREVLILQEEDEGQSQILLKPSEVATFLKTTMGRLATKQ